jgi:hypothetical protein
VPTGAHFQQEGDSWKSSPQEIPGIPMVHLYEDAPGVTTIGTTRSDHDCRTGVWYKVAFAAESPPPIKAERDMCTEWKKNASGKFNALAKVENISAEYNKDNR